MKVIDKLKFSIGRRALKSLRRGYAHLTGGSQHSDWITSGLSDDADLQANWFKLVQRSRDLFKENPYMRKFRADLIANVFGSEGITLQMKIKEKSDRVVFAAEEKAWLEAKQRAHDAMCERAEALRKKLPANVNVPAFRKREFFTLTTTGSNGSTRAKATVKAGQPDVYANNLIERAWKRWQKRENCTVSRRHNYAQTREHRLVMAARDGDCFIRLVRGFKNEFRFAIQIIAAEWVDHSLNRILQNGNYIKMGVEYDQWGAVVRYHVIKRRAGDWLSSWVTGSHGVDYEQIDARDMIHYCQFEDSESGRGAPWVASIMGTLRHLGKTTEGEVISSRAEACKGGHYEAELGTPGEAADLADYIEKVGKAGEKLTQFVEPAMWKTLPPGWTAKAHDPKHPNGNYPAFKKEMLREVCAGIGDQYITFSGDLEGTSYSSGRIGSLDVRELWMLTQRFDIDTAELPIFAAWLEMALMSKAIPLPVTKLEKFNQPKFQGRRWPWVDPMKDAKADQLAIDSSLTSRSRICNENGDDFEEIVEELAMEKILMEEAGLHVSNAAVIPDNEPEDDPEEIPAQKPPPKKSRALAPSRK